MQARKSNSQTYPLRVQTFCSPGTKSMGRGGKKSTKWRRKVSGYTMHSHGWPLRPKRHAVHKENRADWTVNGPPHRKKLIGYVHSNRKKRAADSLIWRTLGQMSQRSPSSQSQMYIILNKILWLATAVDDLFCSWIAYLYWVGRGASWKHHPHHYNTNETPFSAWLFPNSSPNPQARLFSSSNLIKYSIRKALVTSYSSFSSEKSLSAWLSSLLVLRRIGKISLWRTVSPLL